MKANRTLEKCILLFLASVWALVCLFPIWVLFSGTFSLDSSNLTRTFSPIR